MRIKTLISVALYLAFPLAFFFWIVSYYANIADHGVQGQAIVGPIKNREPDTHQDKRYRYFYFANDSQEVSKPWLDAITGGEISVVYLQDDPSSFIVGFKDDPKLLWNGFHAVHGFAIGLFALLYWAFGIPRLFKWFKLGPHWEFWRPRYGGASKRMLVVLNLVGALVALMPWWLAVLFSRIAY